MNTATGYFLGDPSTWIQARVHLSTVQPLWGGRRLTRSGSGKAAAEKISRGARAYFSHLDLGEQAAAHILAARIENDILDFHAPARIGHPDETCLVITLVNAGGERRQVQKWAGDPHPRFETVFRLLFQIARKADTAQAAS